MSSAAARVLHLAVEPIVRTYIWLLIHCLLYTIMRTLRSSRKVPSPDGDDRVRSDFFIFIISRSILKESVKNGVQ